eukprot:TRINITY_DN11274_c0_g1_i1.p2 TRINITY_DN11274_c0_g1~~TRINITY_DN11274_c0_g1_i1.p2  ORF type:complete len:271 (-),score=44.84 TRINITY_DN11274_c0_g1_i1:1433-2161(-)
MISRRTSFFQRVPNGARSVTIPHHDVAWNINQFTLCAWVKIFPETHRFDVVLHKSDNNWSCGFGVDIITCEDNYLLRGFVNLWANSTHRVSTKNLAFNEWVHLAFTCSETTFAIYANGEVGESKDVPGPLIMSRDNFTLGYTRWKSGSWYMRGQITDVRVWSVAFTREQIEREMVSTLPSSPNLICYLPMCIYDRKVVLDCSEFRNHGVLENGCEVTLVNERWPPRVSLPAKDQCKPISKGF